MSAEEYVVLDATLCVVTQTDVILRNHHYGNSSSGIS